MSDLDVNSSIMNCSFFGLNESCKTNAIRVIQCDSIFLFEISVPFLKRTKSHLF